MAIGCWLSASAQGCKRPRFYRLWFIQPIYGMDRTSEFRSAAWNR
ncbi:MAG TPA: hypothetical protein DDX99_14410 [Desulfofustis sp.]|nr:hypothetical protein [Desulfofustis sp.]